MILTSEMSEITSGDSFLILFQNQVWNRTQAVYRKSVRRATEELRILFNDYAKRPLETLSQS